MFVIGNLIIAFAGIIKIILTGLSYLVVIRALVSWVNPDPGNPIVVFLRMTTEPLLDPIRRRLPDWPIDISPLILIILISTAQIFLTQTLFDIGMRLRY